jgi:hypothetical protein
MIITVAYHNWIKTLDWTPNIPLCEYTGFIRLDGDLKEIREIHRTKNGIQIELI